MFRWVSSRNRRTAGWADTSLAAMPISSARMASLTSSPHSSTRWAPSTYFSSSRMEGSSASTAAAFLVSAPARLAYRPMERYMAPVST